MSIWDTPIEELIVGSTFKSVKVGPGNEPNHVVFITEDGRQFEMYHEQDCCEYVYLKKIKGSVDSLIGRKVTKASVDYVHRGEGTETEFAIQVEKRGTVKFIWLGISNGYYSETASFKEVTPKQKTSYYYD